MQSMEKDLVHSKHLDLKFYSVYKFFVSCTYLDLHYSKFDIYAPCPAMPKKVFKLLDDRNDVIKGLNLLYVVFTNTKDGTYDLIKMTNFIATERQEIKQYKLYYFYTQMAQRMYYLPHKVCDTFDTNLPEFKEYQMQGIFHLAQYLVKKFPNYTEFMPSLSKTQKLKVHTVFVTIEELLKPQPNYLEIQSQLKKYSDYIDQHLFFKRHRLFNRQPKPGSLRYILNDIANIVEKMGFQNLQLESKAISLT